MATLGLGAFDYVIYHGGCADGECAAWVVTQFHWTTGLPVPVTIPCEAGKCNTLDLNQFVNKRVIFVDICPDKDTVLLMAANAKRIVVIDHHKNACEALQGLQHPVIQCIFDIKKSGCQLAWTTFFDHPGGSEYDMPWFLTFIGNRDLWDFSLEHTLEYYLGMDDMGLLNPDGFDTMLAGGQELAQKVLNAGFKAKEIQARNVQTYIGLRTECRYKDARVWLVNCPLTGLKSELGNALLKVNFDDGASPDFSVIWYYDIASDSYSLSMRSDDTKRDVSAICREFGGNGHRNAAGCSCSRINYTFVPVNANKPDLPKRMLSNMRCYLVDDIYQYLTSKGATEMAVLPADCVFTPAKSLVLNAAFRDRITELYGGDAGRTNQLFRACVHDAMTRIKQEDLPYLTMTNVRDNGYEYLFCRRGWDPLNPQLRSPP